MFLIPNCIHFYKERHDIGEGNGNPLQCSCLENPRDGGAWWAAVYGVAELDTTEVTNLALPLLRALWLGLLL